MPFQQHFSVQYLHRKPIGFILLRLIYDKKKYYYLTLTWDKKELTPSEFSVILDVSVKPRPDWPQASQSLV